MSYRPELVVIDAPTLLDGAPQLLHAAWAEWWLAKGDAMRELAEAVHQLTDADVVLTPTGAAWL